MARSSAEVQFRSIAHGICEALWMGQLLGELNVATLSYECLFCDNKATIGIANNSILHDRTKHFEVDKHLLKEKLENELIIMRDIVAFKLVVGILAKGLLEK